MSIALRLALAAAVLSGAAALVYEVVWLRMLGLVVGHAVDALTAVLAAFMAGLALGAVLFGRLAGRLRRPLVTCAWVEIGIAGSAAILPAAFAALMPASLSAPRGLASLVWGLRAPPGRARLRAAIATHCSHGRHAASPEPGLVQR
jgi:spermidine synthase